MVPLDSACCFISLKPALVTVDIGTQLIIHLWHWYCACVVSLLAPCSSSIMLPCSQPASSHPQQPNLVGWLGATFACHERLQYQADSSLARMDKCV